MKPSEMKIQENQIREFLIECVAKCEPLWNTSHDKYKDQNVRMNCWSKILKEMKEALGEELLVRHKADDHEKIKEIWNKLRGTYRRNKNLTVGKSGAGAADVVHPQDVKWVFFNKMSFLDSKPPIAGTVSSLNIPENASSSQVFE